MTSFTIYVEDDRIRVKLVSAEAFARDSKGHRMGGDYGNRTIRLPRREYRGTQRAALLHELGHYIWERGEYRGPVSQEDFCEGFSWLPSILTDPRNDPLREFLGLEIR